MRILPWLILILSVCFCACSEQQTKKESDTQKPDSIHGNHVTDSVQNNNKGVPKDRLIFYYDGMIGKNLSIEVTLYEFDDSLSGKYRYTSQVTFLSLKGVVNGKQYELSEYDPKGKLTGYFKGERDEKTQNVTGIWTNTKGNKAFPFTFTVKGQSNDLGDVAIGSKEIQLKDVNGCDCASVSIPVVLSGLYPEKLTSVNSLLSFEKVTGTPMEGACECSEDKSFSYGLVYGSYNVEYNKNMILSIEWWGEGMGAYPSSYYVYININLNTGQPIVFREMLNGKGFDYVKNKVETELNKRLEETALSMKEEEYEEATINEMCQPLKLTSEFNPEFSFTKEGIIVHYDLGFPHFAQCYDPGGNVLIPYAELSSMTGKYSVLEPLVTQ